MAGPRDEDHRSTDRPPVGCDDLYNAETKVGQMPSALLQSLKDQGLTEAEAQSRTAIAGVDPPAVGRDDVPRLYQPKSNDPEDAATQVHQGGNKVALGPPPESTRLLGQDAPPTLMSPTPNGIPAPPSTSPSPSLPRTSPAPHGGSPATPSPPPPITARLAGPSPGFAAPPSPVAPPAVAPPAVAPPAFAPPAFAAPAFAPPAFGPYANGPAAPLHAPPRPADVPAAAPLERPRPASARWVLVVVLSFLVALAVFGVVVVRYVL